ncbi:MAG: hypothetical protein IJ184_05340 [Alphaproteobacteria bacterium]|nr:hypothetical protein [Alphaproteobacteria bacterium]
MKKFIVIALTAMVSACACFDCDDNNTRAVTYQTSHDTKLDCDYFDGKTCYRYVYKNIQRQAPQPAPVYRNVIQPAPVVAPRPAPCGCQRQQMTTVVEHPAQVPAPAVLQTSGNGECPDKISETREPVEIVYKKVTTRTTYEPKTTSQVSYEKAPYTKSVAIEQPEPVEVINRTTTTTIEEIK